MLGSVPFFCLKAGAVGAPVVAPGLLGFRGIQPCPAVLLLTLQMGHGGLTRCRSRGCSTAARSAAAPGRGGDTLGLLCPLVPGSWQLFVEGKAARVPPEPLAMPQAITAPQLCPLWGCSPAPPGWGRCPNACELIVHGGHGACCWPWVSLPRARSPCSTSWAPLHPSAAVLACPSPSPAWGARPSAPQGECLLISEAVYQEPCFLMGPGGGPRWGFPQRWVHRGKRRAAPQHNISLGTAGHGACFHSRAAPAAVPGGGGTAAPAPCSCGAEHQLPAPPCGVGQLARGVLASQP